MAAKKESKGVKSHQTLAKKTSTSGKMSMIKTSSMNKAKKRSFKRYAGQGR